MQPHAVAGTLVFRLTAVGCSATLLATSALPLIAPDRSRSQAVVAGQHLTLDTVDTGQHQDYDVFSPLSTTEIENAEPVDNDSDAPVQFPVVDAVLTDGFGYRTAPVEQFHDAQDFAAAAGTPVHAIADGTVTEAGYSEDGCGFGLMLEHEIDGTEVASRYCHMELGSHDLLEGDTVEVGEQVGRVGNTGMSFGPHLHLVIKVDGEAVDPLPFLTKHNRS